MQKLICLMILRSGAQEILKIFGLTADKKVQNLYNFSLRFCIMNKRTILVAGGFGLIIGLGLLGFRKFMMNKNRDYDDYYADFHRHFDQTKGEDPNDGVELMGVR